MLSAWSLENVTLAFSHPAFRLTKLVVIHIFFFPSEFVAKIYVFVSSLGEIDSYLKLHCCLSDALML